MAAVPRSYWVTLYGLLLLLLIVVYYTAVAVAVLALLDIEGKLVRDLWPIEGLWFLKVNLAFALLFPLTRLATHLWRGVVGLVTERHDDIPDRTVGVLLPQADYPALYAAVAEVGRAVKSPMPDEIRLGYRPDCFAVEQRSFAIRTVRRLVLVIGLPQVEVMTQNELKVIAAHELAHFGAGDTRLGVFVFRFLESLRVAQGEHAGTGWRWVDPVAWLSWSYFHLFLVLSAPIRKHQEFRADGWSAAAYGGEFAAKTLLKDWLLARQFDESLRNFLFRLPAPPPRHAENVFREFSEKFQDLTPEGMRYLEQRLAAEEQPSFWDSHPTIRERMAHMRRYVDRELPEPVPAHLLLGDIDALEKRMQEHLYAQQPAFPQNYLSFGPLRPGIAPQSVGA